MVGVGGGASVGEAARQLLPGVVQNLRDCGLEMGGWRRGERKDGVQMLVWLNLKVGVRGYMGESAFGLHERVAGLHDHA